MLLRTRQSGQSIVEFGIIAILFTLIMFAIADFGLLLNDWLSVSSGARLLARDAAVGMPAADLAIEANGVSIPGVTGDPHFGGVRCCGAGAALVLKTVFYDQCTPGAGPCSEVPIGQLDSRYSSNFVAGGCTSWALSTPVACPHPAPPSAFAACGAGRTCPGDTVVLTLTAAGAQVVTPLVRPFFSSPGVCPDGSSPSRCYVSLSSSVAMRFEGDTL